MCIRDRIGGVGQRDVRRRDKVHRVLDHGRVLALQDQLCLLYTSLKQYDERVKLCVAFGETGVQFQDIFSRVQVVETMQEALDVAIANSKEQDIVLLSPACSSYDQFPNYEVRGTLFKEMVRKWLQA